MKLGDKRRREDERGPDKNDPHETSRPKRTVVKSATGEIVIEKNDPSNSREPSRKKLVSPENEPQMKHVYPESQYVSPPKSEKR